VKPTPQQQHIGRQLIEAAQQLEQAKRFGKVGGSLALAISASTQSTARRKIADLVRLASKYTPGMAKDEAPPGGDWSPIEAFGLSRDQLPEILESLGVTSYDINLAMADAAVAFDLLVQIATQRRASK
jgi:hypothetical protein